MFTPSTIARRLCQVALVSAVLCGACSSQQGNSLLSRKTPVPNQPITTWVWGKYIDENSPLEYYVKFRNTGNRVISFDYTIGDKPNVIHVDRDGPNSGFIPNLYPGAEAAIPNPWKRWEVWARVGKVTYGKRTNAELAPIYPSVAAEPGGPSLETISGETNPAGPL